MPLLPGALTLIEYRHDLVSCEAPCLDEMVQIVAAVSFFETILAGQDSVFSFETIFLDLPSPWIPGKAVGRFSFCHAGREAEVARFL